jgi:hypothetical protein
MNRKTLDKSKSSIFKKIHKIHERKIKKKEEKSSRSRACRRRDSAGRGRSVEVGLRREIPSVPATSALQERRARDAGLL